MTIASKTTALLTALTDYGTADIEHAETLIEKAQKAAADGVAPLDSNAKVPAIHLPSYVDDVLEYATLANFPAFGEAGKIYIAVNAGTQANPTRQYRWTGTVYAEISAAPGSTDVVVEGSTNLYFNETRVRSTALTGLSLVTGGVISVVDTVLQAFGKLQKQITDLLGIAVVRDSATGAAQLPVGTTAQRPAPNKGWTRYNDTTGRPEVGNGTNFVSMGGASGGGNDAVFYEADNTITSPYTIGTNKNAITPGPINIVPGGSVTINPGSTWTIP